MPSRTAAPSESSNYGLTVSTKTCRFIAFPFLRFLRADAQGARPPPPPEGGGGGGLHRPPARPPLGTPARPHAQTSTTRSCDRISATVARRSRGGTRSCWKNLAFAKGGTEAFPKRDMQLLGNGAFAKGGAEAIPRRDTMLLEKMGASAKGGTEAIPVPRRDAMLLEKMGRLRKAGPRRSRGGTRCCWKKWGVSERRDRGGPRAGHKVAGKNGAFAKAGPRRSRGGTRSCWKKWGVCERRDRGGPEAGPRFTVKNGAVPHHPVWLL